VINTINGRSIANSQASLCGLTKFRFYVNSATGASQWEHPSGPAYAAQPAAPPQPAYYPPAQQQYAQQGYAPPPAAAQPGAPAATGIMGKLSNLDPKAQTALAVGGGLAAGALLEHEIGEFTHTPHYPHHGGHHHVLGTMAGLMGAAGAGALGAKFFGGRGQTAQAAPPPPAYPVQAPQAPAYPGQPVPPGAPSSGPGLGGLGKFAAGGAVGMAGAFAANEAASFLHHHHGPGGAPAGALPAAGGGGGMGSLLGGLTYSGPRLNIFAAAYVDVDVTNKVRARVTPEQVLAIDNLADEFGDPWPEVKRKMFSVLYQYGDRPLEVWASRWVPPSRLCLRCSAYTRPYRQLNGGEGGY
jgi:hypothetical protein